MGETFQDNKICFCCLRSCDKPPFALFDEKLCDIPISRCLEEICNIKVSPEDNLPESICVKCFETLQQSYLFRLQVRKNYDFLHKILEFQLEAEPPINFENQFENDFIEKTEESELLNNQLVNSYLNNPCENLHTFEEEVSDYETIQNLEITLNNESCFNNVNKNNGNDTEFLETDVDITIDTKELNKKQEIQKLSKLFHCSICLKEFKYYRNKQTHEKRHVLDGQLKCPHCSKQFHKKYDFNRHIQAEHTDDNNKHYQCKVCKKRFCTKPELNRHSKYHTDTKKHRCEDCDQHFYEKASLTVHIKTVHLKERNHICSICYKSFSTQSKVRRHQNSKICCPIKIVTTIHTDEKLEILDLNEILPSSMESTENQLIEEMFDLI